MLISSKAQKIIDRIAKIDYTRPNVSEEQIRQAFSQHFAALEQPERPVEIYYSYQEGSTAAWLAVGDVTEFYRCSYVAEDKFDTWSNAIQFPGSAEAQYAAWVASRASAWTARIPETGSTMFAWDASWANVVDANGFWDDLFRLAAWSAARSVKFIHLIDRDANYARFCDAWMPFLDAFMAGLFIYWVMPDKVVAIVNPVLKIRDGRLHSDGSPAVEWVDKERYYFWRGIQIPEKYGSVNSERWKAEWLIQEQNAEFRRILIQGIGYARLCQELKAQNIDKWREYTLLRISHNLDVETIQLLKMTCPSTHHIHVLRVPLDITSAREAIQWVNWGIDPEEIAIAT